MQPNLLLGKRPIGTIGYIGNAIGLDEFYWSFIQMAQLTHEYFVQPGTYIHLDRSCMSGQIQARNELVLKMQGDWLLQIDSDHRFEPDLAFRLISIFESQKLDVLTGIYVYKNKPHNPVLFGYRQGSHRNIVDWGSEKVQLLPIGAAGAGCLLVRRKVFDRLRDEFGCLPFSGSEKLEKAYSTDDFNFFEKCRLLGIQCWCAPQVECEHLYITQAGMKDFDRTCAPAAIFTDQEVMA